MNFQGQDPEGSKPAGPRVEDDLERPLRAVKAISHRRLPAALPFAIAGILVVSSVAFGATVVRNLVTPTSSATPVVVGDDPTDAPTDAPTLVPTPTPTPVVTVAPVVTPAPTLGTLTLTGAISGQKVALAWSRYQGDNFGYYKIIRSVEATPTWPLGAGDTLVAATTDIETVSWADPSAPRSKTLFYAVFAVTAEDTGYQVLAASNVVSVTTPAPTPAPTVNCTSLSLKAVLQSPTASTGGVLPANNGGSGYSIKLSWSKYRCSNFQWYGVQMSQSGTPVLKLGDIPNAYYVDNINALSWTDTEVQSGQTYYFRAYAFTEASLGATDGVRPACYATTILAISNVVKVVVP